MAKKETLGNYAMPGISSTSTKKATTYDPEKEKKKQQQISNAAATLNKYRDKYNIDTSTIRTDVIRSSGVKDNLESVYQSNAQRIADEGRGTMNSFTGRLEGYRTPEQLYADRLAATAAANNWENKKRGFCEAIGKGALSGLEQAGSGLINYVAANVAKDISSGITVAQEYNDVANTGRIDQYKQLYQSGKDIWKGYKPGDDTLGKRVKESLFSALDIGVTLGNKSNGLGAASIGNADAARGLAKGLVNTALRKWLLPAITGTDDEEANAEWLTSKAYSATDPIDNEVQEFGFQLSQSGKAANIAGKTAEVVTAMLPSIITSYVTGEQEAGLALMSAQAAGNAAKEEYLKGASAEDAYYVGMETGIVEYLTEHMFGGIEALGKGVMSEGMKKVFRNFAASRIGSLVFNIGDKLGENVEEAVSDWATGGIQKARYGTVSPEEDLTLTQALLGQAPWTEEGLVTLLTTLIMGGMNSAVQNAVKIPAEQAQELIDMAKSTGNTRLVNLADQYQQIVDKRGKLSVAKANNIADRTTAYMGGADAYTEALMQERRNRQTQEQKKAQTQQKVDDAFKGTLAENEDHTATYNKAEEKASFNGGSQNVSMFRGKDDAGNDSNMIRLTEEDGRKVEMTVKEAMDSDALSDNTRTFIKHLSILGSAAPAAYEAYDGKLSGGEYAQAMSEAINLYAANGANLQEVVKKGGENVGVSKLSEAQLAVAQDFGSRIYQQKSVDAQELSTKYKAQVEAVKNADTTTSKDLTKIDQSIADVKGLIQKKQGDLSEAISRLENMDQDTDEYEYLMAEANDYADYIEGAKQALTDLEQARKEAEQKKPEQRRKGTVSFAGNEKMNPDHKAVDRENITEAQKKQVKAVEAIADIFHLDYVFYEADPKGDQGYFISSDGKVYININAGGGIQISAVATLSHELTHALQTYSPKYYDELRNEIVKIYFENDPAKFEKIVRQHMDAEGLKYDDAVDELVANTCTKMLNDSDAIHQLARDNMNLAEKILDDLKQIIKDAFAGIKAHYSEEKFYQQYKNQFEKAVKLWEQGIADAAENVDAVLETKKAEASDGGADNDESVAPSKLSAKESIADSKPESKGKSAKEAKEPYKVRNQKWDSTGEELSEEQQKYFSKSKVRDFFGNLLRLFQGTKSWGFTVFDNKYSDDGLSFFMTDKIDMAQTYSDTYEVRSTLADNEKDISKMDEDQLMEYINRRTRGRIKKLDEDGISLQYKTLYNGVKYYAEKAKGLIEEIKKHDKPGDDVLAEYQRRPTVKNALKELEAVAAFDDYSLYYSIEAYKDVNKHLMATEYLIGDYYNTEIATWNGEPSEEKRKFYEYLTKESFDVYNVYQDLLEMQKLEDYTLTGEAYYDEMNTPHGYRRTYYDKEGLREYAEGLERFDYDERGNYPLYANLENPLIIDAQGGYWNSIRWYGGVNEESANEMEQLEERRSVLENEMQMLFEEDKSLDPVALLIKQIDNEALTENEVLLGQITDELEEIGKKLSSASKLSQGKTTWKTRELAKVAKENGFDGVIIRNVYDDGGQGRDRSGMGTVVIAFQPEQIKDAYNRNPTTNPDIRFQKWVEGQMSMDEWQRESQTETQENEEPDFRMFDMSTMTVKERRATGEKLVSAVKKLFDRIPDYELKPTAEDIEWDLDFDAYASGEQAVIDSDAENILWDISSAVKNGLIDEETGYWVMAAIVQNTNYLVKRNWINKSASLNSKVEDENFYQWYQWNTDDDEGTRYQKWTDEDGYTDDELKAARAADVRIAEENILLGNTIEDLTKEVRKLADESANRAETIDKLRRELKETKTPEAREKDAEKLARKLISKVGSDANIDEVTAEIKGMADYVIQNVGSDIDPDVLTQKAREIASNLVDQARDTIEPTADADVLTEIKKTLKGKRMYIAPEARSDLDVVNGYNRFRTRNMSRFTLVNDRTAQGVDSVYMELQSMYGEHYLPEMNSEGEMLMVMADIFDTATTQVVNPYKNDRAQIIREVANDICYGVLSDEIRQMPATMADKLKAAEDQLKYARRELGKAEKAGEKQDAKIEKLQAKVDVLKGAQTMANRLSKAMEKQTAKYEKLLAKKDERIATVREQGKARIEQARAKEKAAKWEKVKELREYYQDKERRAAERRRESAGIGKYRRQVTEKAAKLTNLLIENSDKRHVPEPLKKPLAEFLESINFDSARKLAGGEDTQADNRFAVTAVKLKNILENQQKYLNGEEGTDPEYGFGGYIDIAPDALQTLKDMSDEVLEAMDTGRSYTVNEMSAEELKNLSNVLSALYSGIRNMNSFMANERYESVREAADADIEHLAKLGKAKDSEGNLVKRFLKWQDTTPYYAMKRFGEGGKAIFEGLTKGWEKMAMNVKEIIEFTKNAYTTDEVNAWKNDIWNIKLEDGSEIRMSIAQIMAFSQLLSREQALKHMEHGGVRIGNIQGKKGEIVDTAHYHFSEADIQNLLKILNDRQMEVATKLRKYMGKRGGELGNEVSERRFGYDFFTEGESYFPIATDSNDRPMADTDAKSNDMFRLLNLGATKSLNPHASNALVVNDIFDVFADHMADMAKYNGMGLSILDAIKWFNFKERTDNEDGTYDVRSLQSAIETAFGTPAGKYFRTLMKDINGVHEGGDRASGVRGLLTSNYKVAAVAANLRVALLQPTAYVRASAVIKPKYLMAAFSRKNASEEALKYSGTAQWKDLGFYDTNISRNMREQIEHADTWKDKVIEASMKGAELGDSRTWGRLWVAAKMQVEAEHPRIKGKELIQKTTDLFRETIYASQVMDSTLTRSELMRSSAFGDKAITAFMAEPTLSYNILLDAYTDYQLDSRENGKEGALKRNAPKLKKAFAVYAASATFSAIMESFVDAMRDSDDEDFWQKFMQAFFGEGDNFIKKFYDGNLGSDFSLIAKIPLAKNLISFIQGYNDSDMSTEGLANLINAFNVWKETIELQTGALEEPTKVTYYGRMTDWGKIYKTLQAVSMLSGLPVSAGARDALAIWNTTVGGVYPEIKVKTYDDNALSGSKLSAYKEFVEPTGMKERQYNKIMKEANTDGNTNVSQEELGTYLMQAEASGELTDAEIYAIWMSKGWKTSYQEWKTKH